MTRLLLILAVLVVVAAGIAYAAIPGGDGTISGCYKMSDGTLRVIDAEAGQTCKSSEKPITWSQTGPPGPPGESVTWRQVFSNTTIQPGVTGTGVVCPAGFLAVGGGWNFNAPGVHIQVWKSIQSTSSVNVWEFGFRNDDSQAYFITTFALCARPVR
jgi:hypothetical protein